MTKFERFYERLCTIMLPMLYVMFLYLVIEAIRICVDWGFSDIECFVLLTIQAIGFAVILLWFICSLIRRRQLSKGDTLYEAVG